MNEAAQSSNVLETKKFSLRNILRRLSSVRVLAFLIIAFQLVILFVLVNPMNIINQLSFGEIVSKVSKLTALPSETPEAIGTVGDNILLPSAELLRSGSNIDAEIYKNALDGDFVLLYSNKMIIFRESENRVIYEGDTPTEVMKNNQDKLVADLIEKVKAEGIIDQDNSEIPQLLLIKSKLEVLKSNNPNLYADAQENDIVAIFAEANKIVLYRSEGKIIIKHGDLSII